MQLQLALDMLTTEEAINIAVATEAAVDIIEIGTPLLKHEGVGVLRAMRERFPDKQILVDLKTMDVGKYEADFSFENGADIVTVLGVADDATIQGAISSARSHGKKVLVDLINVTDKVDRARQSLEWGADYIGIHSGIDQQSRGETPLNDLRMLSESLSVPIAVAGGIGMDIIDQIVDSRPQVVVVGGAITQAADPGSEAMALKKRLGG